MNEVTYGEKTKWINNETHDPMSYDSRKHLRKHWEAFKARTTRWNDINDPDRNVLTKAVRGVEQRGRQSKFNFLSSLNGFQFVWRHVWRIERLETCYSDWWACGSSTKVVVCLIHLRINHIFESTENFPLVVLFWVVSKCALLSMKNCFSGRALKRERTAGIEKTSLPFERHHSMPNDTSLGFLWEMPFSKALRWVKDQKRVLKSWQMETRVSAKWNYNIFV